MSHSAASSALTYEFGKDTAIRITVTECSGNSYSNRWPGIGSSDRRLDSRFGSEKVLTVSRVAAITVVAVHLSPRWPSIPSNSSRRACPHAGCRDRNRDQYAFPRLMGNVPPRQNALRLSLCKQHARDASLPASSL